MTTKAGRLKKTANTMKEEEKKRKKNQQEKRVENRPGWKRYQLGIEVKKRN